MYMYIKFNSCVYYTLSTGSLYELWISEWKCIPEWKFRMEVHSRMEFQNGSAFQSGIFTLN